MEFFVCLFRTRSMWKSCETNGDFKRSGIDRTKSQNRGTHYRNTLENC